MWAKNKPKRNKTKVKDEWKHQKALVAWFKRQYADLDGLLICIGNGAENWGPIKGKIMKDMGVQADVPDLFLIVPRCDYPGLWIEVKKPTGKLSKAQKKYHHELAAQGYGIDTCYGWEHGKNIITSYFSGKFVNPQYLSIV